MNIFKKEDTIFDKVENRILSYIKNKTKIIIKKDSNLCIKIGFGVWIGFSLLSSISLLSLNYDDLIKWLQFSLESAGIGIFISILLIMTDMKQLKKTLAQLNCYNDISYINLVTLCREDKAVRLSDKDLLLEENEIKELLNTQLNNEQKLMLNQIIKKKGCIGIDDLMKLKEISVNHELKKKEEIKEQEKNNLNDFLEIYNLNKKEKNSLLNENVELELNDSKIKKSTLRIL